MGRRKSPGLKKRGLIWWIDKKIKGYGRVAESCRTDSLEEAERYLAFRVEEIRRAMVYGIRPTRTFQQAAIKFLEDHQGRRLLERYAYAFERVMPHIGHLRLDRIHNDTLATFRQARRAAERVCTRRPNTALRIAPHTNLTQWQDSARTV
jgi:hypothetical protein